MVRERDISRGKKVIRSLLGRRSKKNVRFHAGAAEEAVHRLRALEGICGNCQNVRVNVFYKDGKRVTAVDCKTNHSPLELYSNTSLGEVPECPDFTSRR